MDPEWMGAGWYRPADGNHWSEATGKTEWTPCEKQNEHGLMFKSYRKFKEYKRNLRLKDRLNAYNPYK